jgi:hypothetical protein
MEPGKCELLALCVSHLSGNMEYEFEDFCMFLNLGFLFLVIRNFVSN